MYFFFPFFNNFRKTFGTTWIRKVKKAGSELINKVSAIFGLIHNVHFKFNYT